MTWNQESKVRSRIDPPSSLNFVFIKFDFEANLLRFIFARETYTGYNDNAIVTSHHDGLQRVHPCSHHGFEASSGGSSKSRRSATTSCRRRAKSSECRYHDPRGSSNSSGFDSSIGGIQRPPSFSEYRHLFVFCQQAPKEENHQVIGPRLNALGYRRSPSNLARVKRWKMDENESTSPYSFL